VYGASTPAQTVRSDPGPAVGRDKANPPAPPKTEPYKTHLAYVRERRNDADGEAILAEALAKLRGK
jgi:hypothetical protein